MSGKDSIHWSASEDSSVRESHKNPAYVPNELKVQKPDPTLSDYVRVDKLKPGTNLKWLKALNTYFTNLNLMGANLSYSDLRGCTFRNVNLSGANLMRANLSECTFNNVNLSGATLDGANLKNLDCADDTVFAGASLAQADLENAQLDWANLRGVNLEGALMRNVCLTETILYGARLCSVDLTCADLHSANLNGANLLFSKLTGAQFQSTSTDGVQFDPTVSLFQGSKHQAIYAGDCVTIGCCSFPLDVWRSDYKEIGKRHGYTPEQIEEYGEWIMSLTKPEEKDSNE